MNISRMPNPKKTARVSRMSRDKSTAEFCRRIASQLSEHLNTVQIVGTYLHPDGSTSTFRFGSGDLLARMKCSEVWLAHAYRSMEGD
jgi:hypothetical protein